MTTVAPDAISSHLNQDDLPWAQWGEGVEAKMLRVSRETGTWVIINRFAPGTRIPTHHHDGAVHAYTLKGRWHYLEYDFVASPGSFIFEQAGSTHTLEALADSEEPVTIEILAFLASLHHQLPLDLVGSLRDGVLVSRSIVDVG